MSAGVFAIDRGIWEHPSFAPEPFTEREAWIWMVSAAAWGDKRVRVGTAIVELKRGQLAFATRFLAQRWRWAHSRVVRFLILLENETMVSTQPTRQSTLITICNYDKYQFGRNADETQIGTPTGTEVKRARNKEEESNNLRTNKLMARDEKFEEAWQVYPKRDGGNPKAPAAKLFLRWVKSGDDPQAIIDGMKRFAVAEQRSAGTPYIPQMVKWLRDRRWLDYGPDSTIVKFDVRKHIV